ncbi:MAG: SdrD B-like domain-containing protein [Rhodothermales bacterium]
MRTTSFRSLFVASTFLVLVLAAALPGWFANTAQAVPATFAGVATECKIEGLDIGKNNVQILVDGEYVTVTSWIFKSGSSTEYVGFTLDKYIENGKVKAGTTTYTFSGTSWMHPSGTTGMGISNIDFCDANVYPVPDPEDAFCYLIADNDNFKSGSADGLTFLDGSFNEFYIGMTGTPNTEALAFVPETGILYGGDANELVTINVLTGAATVVGSFGSGSGEFGTISLSDVDGLTWDPFQDIMYATSRRNGEDVLFQVDVTTGKVVKNAFGPGVDYVGVDEINNLDDIDDIAISTFDGKMYAIQNESGQDSRLILINKTDGTTTDIGDLDVPNVEGLGFYPDGRLLAITGDATRSVVEISLSPFSSTTTLIENLGVNGFGDYEGIACLTEPDNVIMGSVFVDPALIDLELDKTASVQETQALDTIEYTVTLTNATTDLANSPQANSGVAAPGVTVELFRDNGTVGTYEPGTDELLASTVTAGDGSYTFDVSANGDFLVRVDLSSVANLAVNPTDNIEAVSFAGFGGSSDDHDFFFTTFTTATGISVADTFPANATFVSASTASGSFNNGTKVWSPANLAPGASVTLTINATSTATSTVENCAEVMTANEPDVDSTPGNDDANEDDQDCHSYEPQRDPGTPDVKVEKTASETDVDLGDAFSYTLTASNIGDGPATGVVLTDALPYGVAFVSANPNAGVSYDANTHTITWTVGSLAPSASTQLVVNVMVDWMTGSYTGGFLQDGVYTLQNHPDGSVAPPLYGLRLDKLFGGKTPITFDFEHAQSDMRMRILNGGTSIEIYGQAWGGNDTGGAYANAGLWNIQFVYNTTVSQVPGDDDLYVTAETDHGSVTPLYTTAYFNAGQVYHLMPKSDGNFSFRLGDEDNDNGHRGFDGISGWGWLKHNGDGQLSHKATSDFLFTAHPAPDAMENCVELSAMNETDSNAANNEACVDTPPVDPGANSLSGTVFKDNDQDGILDGGEPGQGGVTINVYGDLNGNGVKDGGEPLYATTVTAGNGTYSVAIPTVGHFVVESVHPATYPANAVLTTDNVETAFFASFGNHDANNNFGFYVQQAPPEVDIKVQKDGDLSAADLGDTIEYTLTATNMGNAQATGVVLTDELPYGVSFVSANPNAGVVYDANTHTITWTVGTLAGGASSQITVNVLVDWMTGTFSGSFLQDGFYRLINHPVHGQAPPPYGLRLDQLYAGTGPITFNFDHPQSDMRMRIENGGSTVTLFGTAWGGIDTGAAYSQDGLWEIYMQYDGTVAPAGGDDDLLVTVETDNGTITPLYTTAYFNAGDPFALTGKSDGNYTFRLGNEDDDLGFRSTPGVSGWGWLSHDGPGDMGYYSASDWGFMATPAPDALENCLTVHALDQMDANPNNDASCFTTVTPPVDDPGLNFITGTVFLDLDQDGVRDGGEPGQDNVTVTVYRDVNTNGQVDGGDTVFSSTVTPANGFYAVLVPETGSFVVTTDFPGSYPAGSALTTDNVETAVFANYWNVDSGNDFGFFAAQQGPEIDLSLEKTADVNAVQVGGFITYTLTLTNSAQAAQAATGIEIWDTFPHALIEIQSTAPAAGVVFNNNNGTLKWTIPSLAPGASTQLTILAEATAVGNAVNCAQVGTATGNDPDSTPGNGNVNEDDYDCFPVEITVNAPVTGSIGDLVFQDQNNNGQWDPGEPGLGGVLVRLYAGACGPNGTPIALRTTQANGSYLFTGLPAGDYCVDVRDDTVPFGYVLSTGNDPMTVTLAQGDAYDDADFGYYYDPQLTTVDLELVKEVDTSSPALNDDVTFTITIRNQGPGTATGVIVRDIIPVGLVFVESSATQGGYEATKLGYWTIGTLEPGQTEVLTITTTVVITNMIENIAQVVAVDQPDIDSTPGNGIPSEDDQDNALVESRGPGAAGDITRAECADIGTINAILYEPNHNIVLAGSEVGSVHISNDQGLNWPVFMQSNGGAAIQDIVATPNGSAIYVGTFGDGVWRSTDGGENWSKYKLGTNTVNDLDLDLNNNLLYAAVEGKVMFIDLGTGTTGTVAGDPFNDQVLSLVYDENTNRLIAASAGAGAWKYEAGSWTDVSAGLPIGKINTMLQTPAGAVLAGTNSDGVYVFGGGGWFQYGMGLDSEPIESLGLGGNGEILAGARESGAYYFNQVSFEWESIGNLPIFTVASMTAGAQGEVYAGAPGEGIYVIYDTDFDGIPDQAHQVANFMTSAVIQDMVVAPNGDIYAASYGYGVLYSSDGGNCWTRMNRGLENLWTFGIARTSDGTLFIGIWADGLGGIWRSTNNGRDWEFLAYGDRQIISLAVDPNDEDIIYAGANLAGEGSIVRSLDGGDTWQQLQSFIQPVWAIQIDPNNSNRIVVGTLGDGIYESLDQGATWNQIGAVANGLADPNGFDLKFGPTGRLFAATNAGVYVYDDQGGFPTYTWSLYGNGSEVYQMRTIEFVGSDIYAGTWNAGLVFYDSGTGDWTDLGLADIPVIAFAVHQASETLVIGTSGSGVYLNHNIRASFATDTEEAPTGSELPSAFSLDQNYPNPFNPQTTIPFGLTESGPVRIAVYDVLGREVSMLVDRVMEPGQHRITWEAGDLPTGNYLVRMEAGGKVFTRSMVLMK